MSAMIRSAQCMRIAGHGPFRASVRSPWHALTARPAAAKPLVSLDLDAMDGPLKELSRLEKLAAGGSAGKGKTPSLEQSLDALLDSLRAARERFQAGTGSQATLIGLAKTVEDKKKEIDERQKEVYNATAKLGKALDKVCRRDYRVPCNV